MAALFLACAFPPAAASADPIGSCGGDSYNLGGFPTPCTVFSILVEGQSASIGGVDVSHASGLGMSINQDAYPPEAHWLLFGVPVSGSLPLDASATTPLEVRYRMSALGGANISLVDMTLNNAVSFGFTAPVEFFVAFDNGSTASWMLQGANNRVFGTAPAGATSMDVRIRVFGTAPQGGVAAGVFAGTVAGDPSPAPVPEPGTLTLLGSGLALAVARMRKRS